MKYLSAIIKLITVCHFEFLSVIVNSKPTMDLICVHQFKYDWQSIFSVFNFVLFIIFVFEKNIEK